MATKAKYHSGKIYVPQDVRDALGLEEGDEMEFLVINDHEVRISVKKVDADQRLLELPPKNLGIKGKLTREEIYDFV